MMTRKDYVKVSQLIRNAYTRECNKEFTLEILAEELAEYFQSDNPNFDEAKFFEACGLEFLAGENLREN